MKIILVLVLFMSGWKNHLREKENATNDITLDKYPFAAFFVSTLYYITGIQNLFRSISFPS